MIYGNLKKFSSKNYNPSLLRYKTKSLEGCREISPLTAKTPQMGVLQLAVTVSTLLQSFQKWNFLMGLSLLTSWKKIYIRNSNFK